MILCDEVRFNHDKEKNQINVIFLLKETPIARIDLDRSLGEQVASTLSNAINRLPPEIILPQ